MNRYRITFNDGKAITREAKDKKDARRQGKAYIRADKQLDYWAVESIKSIERLSEVAIRDVKGRLLIVEGRRP